MASRDYMPRSNISGILNTPQASAVYTIWRGHGSFLESDRLGRYPTPLTTRTNILSGPDMYRDNQHYL